MGFRFKRKESVQHGLRRIARECIDAAIEAMRHSHRGDAIHCVRKDIKKLRAMLRMAQPSLPPKNYRRCMKQLREVARELSVARDAHVKLKAFQSVTSSFGDELRSHQLRYFRESLHRDFQRATWSFTKEKTPARVE